MFGLYIIVQRLYGYIWLYYWSNIIMRKKRRDIVWHIYHTILAVELGAVAIIEFIELMYK